MNSYWTFRHKTSISSLTICDKFQMLISQTVDGGTYFWDMSTGDLIRSFTSNPTTNPCIALDPQNNFVAFTQGQHIQILHLPNLTLWQSIPTTSLKPIEKLIVSPNSQILVIVYKLHNLRPDLRPDDVDVYGALVDFWHLPTQKWDDGNIKLPRLTTSGPIYKAHILISPQWDRLLLAFEYERNDFDKFSVSSYPLFQTEELVSNNAHFSITGGYSFWGYALNPQGNMLAISTSSTKYGMADIVLYSKDTLTHTSLAQKLRRPVKFSDFLFISKITIDKRVKWLALTSENLIFSKKLTHGMQVMPLKSFGKSNNTIDLAKDAYVHCALIYDQESKIVTGSTTGEIKLWELQNGKACGALSGHASPITNLVVTGDGKLLASSDLSNIIKLWRLG